MWEVSFEHGPPYMHESMYVKARSKEEAIAKVKKATAKTYPIISIDWAKPVLKPIYTKADMVAAVAAEREACAAICDHSKLPARMCAIAIRARGGE